MKAIIVILCLVCATKAAAQDVSSTAYLKQVHDFWADFDKSKLKTEGGQLVVAQYSYPYNEYDIKQGNERGGLHLYHFIPPNPPLKRRDGKPVYSVKLTATEEAAAQHFFNNIPCLKWTHDLLGDVDFISSLSIDSFKSPGIDPGILITDTIPQHDPAHNNPVRYYHRLSAPLFIRSNTICLFYICGYGDNWETSSSWGMYIKKNGHWQLYSALREET